MTTEEKREQVIQNITGLLQTNPFTFEFKVKKNPKGIKVIYEVTQEEMDRMMESAAKKHKESE
jgi:intracellular sulfur oxidation DsrE/DsrF family protein